MLRKSYLQTSSKSFRPNPPQSFRCEGGLNQRTEAQLMSPSENPQTSRSKMTFLRGVLAPPGQVGESSFTRKSWPSAHPARRDTRLSKALTFSRRFKRSRTCLLTQSNRRQPPRMPFQELSSLKSIITLDQLISSNRIKKLSPWPITKSKCRESFQPSLSNFAQLSKKEKNWLQGSRWLRVCNKTVQACKRTPYWKSKSTDSRLARGLTRRVISLLYTFLARVAV